MPRSKSQRVAEHEILLRRVRNLITEHTNAAIRNDLRDAERALHRAHRKALAEAAEPDPGRDYR